jgi:tetratricopeptide (TPR) repeat protein
MNTSTSPATKEILTSRGLESFIHGSYSEATTHFEEILRSAPNDTDALHHLAGCQIQLKQYEEAKISIEKALDIDSKNELAWFRLGQIHYTCKRYESAVDAFGKAIEIKPEFSDAWFMGGQALMQNGATNDGMLALKNALAISPSSPIFNEVFGRYFIENKKQIGTLIVAGATEDILLCLPFLLKNRVLNLKITVVTNFKEGELLFKSAGIPINQFILCSDESEVTKIKNHMGKSREHYSCPKQWLQ